MRCASCNTAPPNCTTDLTRSC
ncbi:MAG TPA: hypothetical protein DCQ04_16525 [Actinobacteria bacterium]|nr:hypothetical protein [Actinomycetota bacterium]